jgi:hypothetical protein
MRASRFFLPKRATAGSGPRKASTSRAAAFQSRERVFRILSNGPETERSLELP